MGWRCPPDLISTVTDAVLETVAEWRNRPLETSYPLVFFDAIRVKIRDEGLVRNKAVYLALGVAADGTKDILGLWIETSEGAKFWLKVMNEPEGSWRRGHPDRRGRRPEGLSGGDRGRLSASRGSNLHRSSDPQFAGFCVLERPQAHRRRTRAKSTAPQTPRPAARRSRPSRAAHGAENMRQLAKSGGGNGSRSSRSSPSLRRFGKSSTPQTRSRP